MSKRLLSAALIAGLGMAFVPGANAADGTISFTGQVTSATCTINSGTGDFTVKLPESVSTSTLNAVGATAGRTLFSIKLTGCSGTGDVSAYFEPGSTVNADGRLNNTGLATGVELQLRNAATDVINLSTQADTTIATIDVDGNATLNYSVEYYASGAVNPGSVASTLDYTIQYR